MRGEIFITRMDVNRLFFSYLFLYHKRKGIKVDTKLILEQFSILKVSKVIRNHIGFAVPHYAIGPENLHHFHNQSHAKLKPNTNWLHASSHT